MFIIQMCHLNILRKQKKTNSNNNNNRPPKRNGTKKYEQTSDGWLKKNVENTKIGWNKDK